MHGAALLAETKFTMIKYFCDRCGEPIKGVLGSTGAQTNIQGPKKNEHTVWVVKIKIESELHEWKLCDYCCCEIIDEAHQKLKEEWEKK